MIIINMSDFENRDAYLIAQILSGNRDCAEELVRNFHDDLIHTLYISGVPHGEVDDLAQEIALEILRSLSRFNLQKAFQPWMRTIVRRRVKNYWRNTIRARKRNEKFREYILIERESTDDSQGQEERSLHLMKLKKCMSTLPDGNREILEMCYFKNLNSEEISIKLGRKATAIRKALSRIRQNLYVCMRSIEEKAVL